jgi:uncharacterized repeat protein (TIGR03803 family)
MFTLKMSKLTRAVFLGCLLIAIAAQAQVVKTIFSFDGSDGQGPPYMSLIQGTDGNLYGTTEYGGTFRGGTVFKVSPDGVQTVLYNFCEQLCADGEKPYSGLVQATDGNFYGTTPYGGAYSYGIVYKITPAGALSVLYNFCPLGLPCVDGERPTAALVQGIDGNLYGTTFAGGTHSAGTVFKITLNGEMTTLYSFCQQESCPDGSTPASGALVQGIDGALYGAAGGGLMQDGEIFRITPSGQLTVIYNFCPQFGCLDGVAPVGISQGADGNFYGATFIGGAQTNKGTLFKLTLSGKLTTLYRFCTNPNQNGGCPDGALPLAAPALGSDGFYFGMTEGWQAASSIYGVTPSGGFEVLYRWPLIGGGSAGLFQGTDGLFYATNENFGTFHEGAVFSLDVQLGPLVRTSPLGGRRGATITILGTNLTEATGVTFNGTAANFTVVSASEITAIVPSGATTGRVKVITPNGTLVSNLPFVVQ